MAGREGLRALLHTCCGPCASACVPRLKELGHEVTMLFANSNIDTKAEFERRRREAEKLAAVEGVKLVALEYDHDDWLKRVANGLETEHERQARCERCFRYNLGKAAEYAAKHHFELFTTSLTVSPHKPSAMVFGAAPTDSPVRFLPEDFKKREGFKLSVRRAAELGLYRQSYCGCEFSRYAVPVKWRIRHRATTESTNLDARGGEAGDVFTADFQTAGRGRLDHKWVSSPKTNLLMSAVVSAAELDPAQLATLPLVAGLAVVRAVKTMVETDAVKLKWPNDVLIGNRKVAGILCERHGEKIVIGIGLNVGERDFAPEIAARATSLAQHRRDSIAVAEARESVLGELGRLYNLWRQLGFAAIYPAIAAVDCLRGKEVKVLKVDGDAAPECGLCEGIAADGALLVAGNRVYAGEAHVGFGGDGISET